MEPRVLAVRAVHAAIAVRDAGRQPTRRVSQNHRFVVGAPPGSPVLEPVGFAGARDDGPEPAREAVIERGLAAV